MKFSDFTDEELIGKDICIWLKGRHVKNLSKIVDVSKEYIVDDDGNRYQKGGFGMMIGTASDVCDMVTAELVSPEQAKMLKENWARNEAIRTVYNEIKVPMEAFYKNYSDDTSNTLKQIKEVLDKSDAVK